MQSCFIYYDNDMMFKNYQRMKEYQLIFIVLTATVRNLFKRSAMFQRTIESVNHKVPLTITTEKDMVSLLFWIYKPSH